MPPPPNQPVHGSHVNASIEARLDILLDLCRRISSVESPNQVVYEFGQYYQRVNPSDYYISLSVRGLEPGEYKITRRVSPELFERIPDDRINPWRDWNQLPVHTGGFLGELIDAGEPRLFNHLRIENDPVLADEIAPFGSCVARPIFDQGKALNWALNFRRDPEGYAPDDLVDALLIANLVGTTTRNMLEYQRNQQLADALRAQFEQVARVQQSLLPRRVPTIPGLKIATSYLTSDQAGGDYYDFFKLPDNQWGILIADVSGHGAAAATVMAMLHAILHGYEGPDFDPATIIGYANRRLLHAEIENTFVTAFLGVYDPDNATLTYARSGHNPPRLKDGSSGSIRALDGAGSIPLGITDDIAQPVDRVTFNPGDTLVLYTDGITEAFNPERQMFGTDGLDATLLDCSGDPDCVIDSVHSALFRHTGVRTRDDDQTLVALRYLGPEPAR
ncbi:MAG: PP2C family protein-serine/threonine phosphatase [Phycisphaerales bacterium JB037]